MKRFFESQLPNAKFRYTGNYYGINFTIDSKTPKEESDIEYFLDSCSVSYLLNNTSYIINVA